jgi:hypothetical protein
VPTIVLVVSRVVVGVIVVLLGHGRPRLRSSRG